MVYDIIDLKTFILGSFGTECYTEHFFYRMIKYLWYQMPIYIFCLRSDISIERSAKIYQTLLSLLMHVYLNMLFCMLCIFS